MDGGPFKTGKRIPEGILFPVFPFLYFSGKTLHELYLGIDQLEAALYGKMINKEKLGQKLHSKISRMPCRAVNPFEKNLSPIRAGPGGNLASA